MSGQSGLLGWAWRGYMRKRRAPLILAMALMTVEGSMVAFLSWLIKPMFDRVFVGGQTGAVVWVAAAVW
ncbi:MAG: ABC transporter ATP-binding protein, partial [Sphingomonadales bacterium]|nr:ABC transporter ATP-binding protein [Sphingomonadales bacterium]